MLGGVSLLAFLVLALAVGEYRVLLMLPHEQMVSPKLFVRYFNSFGQPLPEGEARVAGRWLVFSAPRAASGFCVTGPSVQSMRVSLTAAVHSGVELRESGKVRALFGHPLHEVRVQALDTGGLLTDRVFAPTDPNDSAVTLDFPDGTYTLALDEGPESPVAVLEGVRFVAGTLFERVIPRREGRPLAIIVTDRVTKTPIRDAWLAVRDAKGAADRVTSAALARRCRPTGPDGILDMGSVLREERTLRVHAAAHRSATVRLKESFEGGRLAAVLASHQDLVVGITGIVLRRGEARPVVAIAQCEGDEPAECQTMTWSRRTVADDMSARFPHLAPGRVKVVLERAGYPRIGVFAELSDRSEDSDTAQLRLEVEEDVIRGRTVLLDGNPAVAKVRVRVNTTDGAVQSESGESAAIITSADGTFEVPVAMPRGQGFSVIATAEDPRGRGVWRSTMPRSEDGTITIVLITRILSVVLKDRRDSRPIAGCPVIADWYPVASTELVTGGSQRLDPITTDESGRAEMTALRDAGTMVFSIICDGYAAVEHEEREIKRDGITEQDFLLDRTSERTLIVRGPGGDAIGGAQVLATMYWGGEPAFDACCTTPIGVTNEDGTLQVETRYAGTPIFVVAANYSLWAGRLPAMSSCDQPSDCDFIVALRPPSSFPGFVLKGGSLSRTFVTSVLSQGGMSIPVDVIRLAMSANGLPLNYLQRSGEDLEFLAPAVLSDGDYRLTLRAYDQQRKSYVYRDLGGFRVPLREHIEIEVGSQGKGPGR